MRRNTATAPKQWAERANVRVLARLVEGLTSPIGYTRNAHPFGALSIITMIDDSRGTALEHGLDYTEKACELSQEMLQESGARWAAYITPSDPTRAFPAFSVAAGACFTSLTRAQ